MALCERKERNIFPFQESADIMINSALLYELAVLKPYICRCWKGYRMTMCIFRNQSIKEVPEIFPGSDRKTFPTIPFKGIYQNSLSEK